MLSPAELRLARQRARDRADAEDRAAALAVEQANKRPAGVELAADQRAAARQSEVVVKGAAGVAVDQGAGGLVRRAFLINRAPTIPMAVFKDLMKKPALGCGLDGLLVKVKARANLWCVTVEGRAFDVDRFKEYIMTGQHAFGKSRTNKSAHSIESGEIKGFHFMKGEITVYDSDETSDVEVDEDSDGEDGGKRGGVH